MADEQVYVRQYSELEGLQHACTVEYLLYMEQRGPGIEVRRSGPDARSERFVLCGRTAAYARRLLRFLYENAVPVESLGAVLEDCRAL